MVDDENSICLEFSGDDEPAQNVEEEFWGSPLGKPKSKMLPMITKKSRKKRSGKQRAFIEIGDEFTSTRPLRESKSYSNLRSRKQHFDRRPRVGWGYQNTSIEDVQEKMHQVKRETVRTNKENTQLKSKIRRLERDMKKKDKTVQSLLSMAVDERELPHCDKICLIQQTQAEAMNLKKENESLKQDLDNLEERMRFLESQTSHSRVHDLEQRVLEFQEEMMELQRLLHEKTSRNAQLESKTQNQRSKGKKLTKELHAVKKALSHERKHSKQHVKLAESRHEELQQTRLKLARAETKLDENLRSMATLKNKMARVERSMRKQMHSGGQRKVYYDIEKDMDKLRRKLSLYKRKEFQFLEILSNVREETKVEEASILCQNIEDWFNLCNSSIETGDVAFHVGEYMHDIFAPEEDAGEPTEDEAASVIQRNWRKHNRKRKEENEAATKVQKHWRGHKAREELEQKKEAATKIQKNWRGHKEREQIEKQNEAATTIQKNWRGHANREELEEKKQAATKIQKNWRGHKDPKQLQEMDEAAQKIQKSWKNHHEKSENVKSKELSQDEAATKIQTEWRKNQSKKAKSIENKSEDKTKHGEDILLMQNVLRANLPVTENVVQNTNKEEKIDDRTAKIDAKMQNASGEDVTLVQSMIRRKSKEFEVDERTAKIDAKAQHAREDKGPSKEDVSVIQNLVRSKSPELSHAPSRTDILGSPKENVFHSRTLEMPREINANPMNQKPDALEKNSDQSEDVELVQSLIRAKSQTEKDSEKEENVALVQNLIRSRSPDVTGAVKEIERERE